MTGYSVRVRAESGGLSWFDRDALLTQIALPSAFRAYRGYLTD